MNTVTFEISTHYLFESLGLNDFDGDIVNVEILEDGLKVKVKGSDYRLPHKDNYPECYLLQKIKQTRFEEI